MQVISPWPLRGSSSVNNVITGITEEIMANVLPMVRVNGADRTFLTFREVTHMTYRVKGFRRRQQGS